MILKIFTVYDLKTEAYLNPLFYRTRGEFLRGFVDTLKDPNSMIAKHPEDYIAYEIGEWDDSDGSLGRYDPPVALGKAVEYLAQTDIEEKLL